MVINHLLNGMILQVTAIHLLVLGYQLDDESFLKWMDMVVSPFPSILKWLAFGHQVKTNIETHKKIETNARDDGMERLSQNGIWMEDYMYVYIYIYIRICILFSFFWQG